MVANSVSLSHMRYLFVTVQAIILYVACISLCSCANNDNSGEIFSPTEADKSIVILFESDSHCELSGYPKLAGLRDAINRSDTAWAGAVCCGDFVQGGAVGAVSKGQYVVDIMKAVGYDAVTLGNHEFEFGGPNMTALMEQLKPSVVCANFFIYGESKAYYPAYIIRTYGNKRVAFVGVLTPETMVTQKFAFFDGQGQQLYDLKGDGLEAQVQQAVDEAREEGADYVVMLSHVGEKSNLTLNSHDLIKGTRGIDVVLDGHTHSSVPHVWVENLDGKPVLVSQSGNKFKHIGKLVIKPNGELSTSLLPTAEISETSAAVTKVLETVQTQVTVQTSKVVCHSGYPLIALGEDKYALSTKCETAIGDLVTDAYREFFDADIGLQSGNTLSYDIAAGDIRRQDLLSLLPFEDQIVFIEVKGDLLLETLVRCTKGLPNFNVYFPQCSGLQYTVHQKSNTVTDVKVLDRESGEYLPLDPEKTYKVSLSELYSSIGYYGLMKDCKVIKSTSDTIRDALEQYLVSVLKGELGDAYKQSQGRITILDD